MLMKEMPGPEERGALWQIERESGTFHFGRDEGLAEGLAQGRIVLVELILALLADRGVDVDAHSEQRIRGFESLEELQRLARLAATATRIDALFEAQDQSNRLRSI